MEVGVMLMLALASITLAGKLWSGDAGRLRKDPDERENEVGCTGCWRGVMSNSLSSCILSIAPPVVAEPSYQLGDRGGGLYPSSCGLNGLRTRAGDRGSGDSEADSSEREAVCTEGRE